MHNSGLPLSFKIWKSETAISLKNWKSQYIVKKGKELNFGSHKEKLGVNYSQTSTNGSPDNFYTQLRPCFLLNIT